MVVKPRFRLSAIRLLPFVIVGLALISLLQAPGRKRTVHHLPKGSLQATAVQVGINRPGGGQRDPVGPGNDPTLAPSIARDSALGGEAKPERSPAPPGLSILASGARRVEVTDPLGRRILRDAGTGEGMYEIPGAAIEDVSSEHDNGGDVDDPLTGYDIEIPDGIDGSYHVHVHADDGLSMNAVGHTSSGIFAYSGAVDTTLGPIERFYRLDFSGVKKSIALILMDSTGTDPGLPH